MSSFLGPGICGNGSPFGGSVFRIKSFKVSNAISMGFPKVLQGVNNHIKGKSTSKIMLCYAILTFFTLCFRMSCPRLSMCPCVPSGRKFQFFNSYISLASMSTGIFINLVLYSDIHKKSSVGHLGSELPDRQLYTSDTTNNR